jgi:RNA polymerase sigma factor (sigma-70 family)
MAGTIGRMNCTLGGRVAEALAAWCHPRPVAATSVQAMTAVAWAMAGDEALPLTIGATRSPSDLSDAQVDAFVADLYRQEAVALVRLARLFVDDLNAAEDLVQEAFIRLARAANRIDDRAKAAPYLRSIVLNLARDHNRRGLVSLRHQLPFDEARAGHEDEIVLRDDQQRVLDAVRDLPLQQRKCVVLRHYEELGIAAIAKTLGISENSVKTHLKRGMAALAAALGLPEDDE